MREIGEIEGAYQAAMADVESLGPFSLPDLHSSPPPFTALFLSRTPTDPPSSSLSKQDPKEK
jgi:hypothetical protein